MFREVASARAFLEDESFETVVSVCDLKPIKGWDTWEDDAGNILRVEKNKRIRTYPTKHELTYTKDLYFKAPPAQILQHSYWLLALIGEPHSAILLMGNDGRLRFCYFVEGVWKANYFPLTIGINPIKTVVNGYINVRPRKVKIPKTKFIKPKLAYATGWPTKDVDIKREIECLTMTK